MSKYMLFQDKTRCIGCLACTIACKLNKGLGVGPRPLDVIALGPVLKYGKPLGQFVFMPCFHCEEPWCMYACPTSAIKKRAEDGIVYIDQSLCVGCKSCIYACPWGAPQFDVEKGKAVKCDYCKDRIDQGQKPACVSICISHCLSFGPANEVEDRRRRRYAIESTQFPVS
jgi:Fe-S-cluster-containing dehydrogenase component